MSTLVTYKSTHLFLVLPETQGSAPHDLYHLFAGNKWCMNLGFSKLTSGGSLIPFT